MQSYTLFYKYTKAPCFFSKKSLLMRYYHLIFVPLPSKDCSPFYRYNELQINIKV